MSDFPSLFDVVAAHTPTMGYAFCYCSTPDKAPPDGNDWTPQHVAEMWREACTITTVEQLGALPPGAIVLVKQPESRTVDSITRYVGGWFNGASSVLWQWEVSDLPARLLHHPDWPAL